MKKRILSLFMVVMMVLSMFGTTGMAMTDDNTAEPSPDFYSAEELEAVSESIDASEAPAERIPAEVETPAEDEVPVEDESPVEDEAIAEASSEPEAIAEEAAGALAGGETAVAKIGDEEYSSLQDAITAVYYTETKTATVTLLGESDESQIIIWSGCSITLDSNGYAVNGVVYNYGNAVINGGKFSGIQNGAQGAPGTLTIYGGEFKTGLDANNVPVNAVGNSYGTVEIYGGTFTSEETGRASVENLGQMIIHGGTFSGYQTSGPAVANTSFVNGSVKGDLTIYGGSFTGNGGNSNTDTLAGLQTENGASTKIYDGEFVGNASVYISTAGSVTITGGKFESLKGKTVYVGANSSLTITGGTFAPATSRAAVAQGQNANVTITGGKFARLDGSVANVQTLFLKNTNYVQLDDGTVVCKYVARIGDNEYYETLQAAIEAAEAGDTVTLLRDVTVQNAVKISKNLTLDLGGKELSGEGSAVISITKGTVTIQNGVVTGTNGVYVQNQGTACVLTNVEVNGSGTGANNNAVYVAYGASLDVQSGTVIKAAATGINMWDDNTSVTIRSGAEVHGGLYGVAGNGSKDNDGSLQENTLIVEAGAEITGDYQGIYHPQGGSVTINGTVTGATGIEMRAGELTVNDGAMITATAENFVCNANGSGTTTSGAAIAIAQHTSKQDIKVTINGGTFAGVRSLNESNPQENDPAPQVEVTVKGGNFEGDVSIVDADNTAISGGIYSNDVTKYCVEGKKAQLREGTENTWIIVDRNYAAQIGETKYETLQAAVAAAEAGDTVTLLKDVTIDSTATLNQATIIIPAGVTLDGDGHTITAGEFADKAHMLGVNNAAGVKIQNLTVDMGKAANSRHALNVWGANASVTLTKVELKNANTAGLVVNEGTVDSNSTKTSGNGWYGINVDKSGTLTGNYSCSEEIPIYSEDADDEGGSTVKVKTYKALYALNGGGNVVVIYNTEENAAAKIGEQLFAALPAAIEVAKAGDTVTLLKNADKVEIISKEVTLDLNGNTIEGLTVTGVGTKQEEALVVTVSNGTIDNINVSSNGKIYATAITADSIVAENGRVQIASGTYGSIAMSGSPSGSLYITGGTIGSVTGTNGCSMQLRSGTYNGDVSASEKAKLTIAGGTYNGNVSASGNAKVTISGGTYNGNVSSENATLTISAGTFVQNVKDYVIAGKAAVKQADGRYLVRSALGDATVTAYNGGKVEGSTATFDGDNTLVYTAEANDEGRAADKWWAGIKVTAPAGASPYASYQKVAEWWLDDGSENVEWTDMGLVQADGQYWAMVTPAYMEQYKSDDNVLLYRYAFDWDGDGTYEQEVTIKVTDEVKYSADGLLGTVEAYNGGTVAVEGNNVTVTFDENNTLVYTAEANDEGRAADKWWAGIKVTAPAGASSDATYQKIAKWWEDDGTMTDWTDAATAQADGQYWAMVTPSYMEQYKGEDNALLYRYAFDWDGDGINDQYVTIVVTDGVQLVHDCIWDEGKVTTEPTCTEKGVKTYTCTVEGCTETKTEEIASNPDAHKYTKDDGAENWVVKEATCTETGTETLTCVLCGHESGTKVIPAKGHDMQEVEGSAVTPTCTEEGKEADKKCANCDYTETGAVIPTTGHTPDRDAATCTEAVVCTVCNAELEAAAGHDWSDWGNNSATCGEGGEESRTCSRCDISEVRNTDPTGHSWGDTWVTTLEPGCETTGTEMRQCSVCQAYDTETARTLSATGHSWSEWTDAAEATCVAAGTETRTCAACDDVETHDDADRPATGHDRGDVVDCADTTCTVCGTELPGNGEHTYVWVVDTEATIETEGSRHQECEDCGATNGVTETIERLPAPATPTPEPTPTAPAQGDTTTTTTPTPTATPVPSPVTESEEPEQTAEPSAQPSATPAPVAEAPAGEVEVITEDDTPLASAPVIEGEGNGNGNGWLWWGLGILLAAALTFFFIILLKRRKEEEEEEEQTAKHL